MHQTGVLSQGMVLQVVHTERLVTETCRCDLSPSVSRPLVVKSASVDEFLTCVVHTASTALIQLCLLSLYFNHRKLHNSTIF